MKEEKYTLIDTYCEGGYTYEDYKEWCEEMGEEPAEEDSIEYWNWIGDTLERDVDDFFANLSWATETPVLIMGSCGTWMGKREIVPVFFQSADYEKVYNGEWRYTNPALKRAIKKCINNVDAFKVEFDNGVINVYGYHHDGTNCFEIRPLSKKGEEYATRHDFEDGEPVYGVEVKDYMLKLFKSDEC